jgi:hypothetical protein
MVGAAVFKLQALPSMIPKRGNRFSDKIMLKTSGGLSYRAALKKAGMVPREKYHQVTHESHGLLPRSLQTFAPRLKRELTPIESV